MPIAYIRGINPVTPLALVEIIELSPGSPPPRPTPMPPEPPLIIWGPGDPRPTHPIQLPPWAGKPQPPLHPPVEGETVVAVIRNTPADTTPPPEGIPAGSQLMDVWFGPGTVATKGWIFPYASTGPITPPPDPVPA